MYSRYFQELVVLKASFFHGITSVDYFGGVALGQLLGKVNFKLSTGIFKSTFHLDICMSESKI